MMIKATDIDSYIAGYPKEVQDILQQVRATIHKAAPDATEAISYGIPTFKLNGNLVHFGGFKKHIGFYPSASGVKAFEHELAGYAVSRGTVQFPLGQTIPHALIAKIVRHRVKENLVKQAKANKAIG